MERKARNGWALEEMDIWFNFYLSNLVMTKKSKAGSLRIIFSAVA